MYVIKTHDKNVHVGAERYCSLNKAIEAANEQKNKTGESCIILESKSVWSNATLAESMWSVRD